MLFPDMRPCCRNIEGHVAGIDEVGTGSIIIGVTAAAVVFRTSAIPEGIADSKKLSSKKRAALVPQILECAWTGIGTVTTREINRIGVYEGTHLAMRRAFMNLGFIPDHALVDGDDDPKLGIRTELAAKLDGTCPSVGAASILAKEHRDALIDELCAGEDPYGWATNRGYATKAHLEALAALGPSEHHRDCKPVRRASKNQQRPRPEGKFL